MNSPFFDAIGYTAAFCVLATFAARSMVRLRSIAIVSNLAFLMYGFPLRLWPIVCLHGLLLPLNLHRLTELVHRSSLEGDAEAEAQSRGQVYAFCARLLRTTGRSLRPRIRQRRFDAGEERWSDAAEQQEFKGKARDWFAPHPIER